MKRAILALEQNVCLYIAVYLSLQNKKSVGFCLQGRQGRSLKYIDPVIAIEGGQNSVHWDMALRHRLQAQADGSTSGGMQLHALKGQGSQRRD